MGRKKSCAKKKKINYRRRKYCKKGKDTVMRQNYAKANFAKLGKFHRKVNWKELLEANK